MTDLREILSAIFYLNKTGCSWRYLPKDFLPYKPVNYIKHWKKSKSRPDSSNHYKAARQLITDMFLFLHTVTKIWADNGYSVPELSDWLWHPIRMPDRGR